METFLTSNIVSPVGACGNSRGGWDADAGRGRLVTVCSGCSMGFLARISVESCGNEPGRDHENKGDRDEGERSAPAAGLSAGIWLRSVREDLEGQRRIGAAEHVRVRSQQSTKDGKDQRRRLTRGASYRQQRAADDAAERG